VAALAVGVLASDDEAVYPLDRPYVIGRSPLNEKAVRDSMASPISLPDDPQISRVHAYVWVTGGRVLVRDAGTPAGTFIAAPGDREWTRIGTTETEVKAGWCIRIGKRILAYQKADGAQ
jgi:pSer/pThr/pTyr-binding forkhead associated (FHA) protein